MSVAIDNARTKPIAQRDLRQPTDEELLLSYRSSGNRAAFEGLVARTSANCTAICGDIWGMPHWRRTPFRQHSSRST